MRWIVGAVFIYLGVNLFLKREQFHRDTSESGIAVFGRFAPSTRRPTLYRVLNLGVVLVVSTTMTSLGLLLLVGVIGFDD